jgi:hypothetical protein
MTPYTRLFVIDRLPPVSLLPILSAITPSLNGSFVIGGYGRR